MAHSSRPGNRGAQVDVVQLGARMHYAVPRILERAGLLRRLYTDACAKKGLPRLLRHIVPRHLAPASMRRLFDRIPEGVPQSKITAFTAFGIRRALRQRMQSGLSARTAEYLWAGRKIGTLVAENGWKAPDGVYAFKTAALEVLRAAKRQGATTILEQPNVHRAVMHDLLSEEHDRHPGWEPPREKDVNRDEEIRRERGEWEHADLIVCPSTFVQDGIQRCGGPAERTKVLPYGVDVAYGREQSRGVPSSPLHVLMVGTVGLRKGAPYLMRAAERSPAQFRAVGPVELKSEAREQLSQHVQLTGRVPRSTINKHYEWADVFVLPSICEGSATVVYEALAHALPVICTPNTGSIIRDEIDGFVVPIRDAEAIVNGIERLASDADLYRRMSTNARSRYGEKGSLEAYADRLLEAITKALSS